MKTSSVSRSQHSKSASSVALPASVIASTDSRAQALLAQLLRLQFRAALLQSLSQESTEVSPAIRGCQLLTVSAGCWIHHQHALLSVVAADAAILREVTLRWKETSNEIQDSLDEVENGVRHTNEVWLTLEEAEEQLPLLLEGQGPARPANRQHLVLFCRVPKAIGHERGKILFADGLAAHLRAVPKHHEGGPALNTPHLPQQ
mmetsp:Transcript_35818/g.66723  ORF Transcript_35818/g.66723 Transcript_35818/m.66723 type:complete len:203 (+) Transcript_35818:38-646(+)